ncbi:MAG: PEP-CTERM sorting domain-containing protein [Candidatus Omnitrophota bacterium]|nr:PEP-CTERM sorting domain-containing protein [Candidatus Omnitrophota bacterium]
MKKLLILAVIALGILVVNPSMASATVWTADFSNVTGWSPAEGATFTSDGSAAKLEDTADGSGVATWAGTHVDYQAGDLITLVVSGVHNAPVNDTYWRLSIHQFDIANVYLGELELLPYSHSTGTFSSSFAGLNASTVKYDPSLRISTISGTGDATFDNLSVVPEPASLLLLGSGLLGLISVSRKRK